MYVVIMTKVILCQGHFFITPDQPQQFVQPSLENLVNFDKKLKIEQENNSITMTIFMLDLKIYQTIM